MEIDRKLKILFTTSNFDTAGSGKVIYDLVKGLDKNKLDISIACSHSKGAFFKTVEALGLPIYIIDTKTNYRPYYSLYFRIKKISRFIKKHDFDIVHSWQWSNDWTETIATKLAGAKWIYTKKAMGFKSKHWHLKSYLADFIITINDEMWEYFSYKQAQRLIPLGIDIDYYSPNHFSKSTHSNEFQIITVANLVPLKGIEVLIEAIATLKDTSVRLSIVGACDNNYGNKMKSLSNALGITNQVSFLGKQLDVRPFLVEADLYIIPTKNKGEGMPMALVEAMSMKTPVLGSKISGIKYILKDFQNLMFEANNVEELSKKIKTIMRMTKQDREELGNSLRSYCKEYFSIERFILSHENLYHELFSKSTL